MFIQIEQLKIGLIGSLFVYCCSYICEFSKAKHKYINVPPPPVNYQAGHPTGFHSSFISI